MRRPNRELPDYLKRGLDVVFVGFNPGERSAHIGHYYAGRGNQFWNFLYESGLVPERLRPERALVPWRPPAGSDERERFLEALP